MYKTYEQAEAAFMRLIAAGKINFNYFISEEDGYYEIISWDWFSSEEA